MTQWPHDVDGRPYLADSAGNPVWPDEVSHRYWSDQASRGFPGSQPQWVQVKPGGRWIPAPNGQPTRWELISQMPGMLLKLTFLLILLVVLVVFLWGLLTS